MPANVVIADFSNFTLGVKVVIFKRGHETEMQIPEISGKSLAAIAEEYEIENVLLRGPKDFTAQIKKEMLVNYSTLNITCI